MYHNSSTSQIILYNYKYKIASWCWLTSVPAALQSVSNVAHLQWASVETPDCSVSPQAAGPASAVHLQPPDNHQKGNGQPADTADFCDSRLPATAASKAATAQ